MDALADAGQLFVDGNQFKIGQRTGFFAFNRGADIQFVRAAGIIQHFIGAVDDHQVDVAAVLPLESVNPANHVGQHFNDAGKVFVRYQPRIKLLVLKNNLIIKVGAAVDAAQVSNVGIDRHINGAGFIAAGNGLGGVVLEFAAGAHGADGQDGAFAPKQ